MNKGDREFIGNLLKVKKELHRRLGRKMCKELNGNCFDCKARVVIAYLNEWIDLLED